MPNTSASTSGGHWRSAAATGDPAQSQTTSASNGATQNVTADTRITLYRARLFAESIILSATLMTLEFVSKLFCVVIRSTIS